MSQSVRRVSSGRRTIQTPISSIENPFAAWYQTFEGVQIGVFMDYETTRDGNRTGFCAVKLGTQNVRARLNWLSDGKMAHLVMPIPKKTLMAIAFVEGQNRSFAEAVVLGPIESFLTDPENDDLRSEFDGIFQDAKPGEHILRSRWNESGQPGKSDDKTTLLRLKADGSVQVIVDESKSSPVTLTISPDGNVTLENANEVKATAQKVVVDCPDINLGGESGSPSIRQLDKPQHIDPSTGILVTAFQYTSVSQKVKAE